MRLNLIKRRIARLMAFVLIFLMTAESFSNVYIYADEDIDAEYEKSEQESDIVVQPADDSNEETADHSEEAAGEAGQHHVKLYNKDNSGLDDEFDIYDGYDIVSIGRVPSEPVKGEETETERFKYWYDEAKSPATEYVFSSPVHKDLNLKQHWVNIYRIRFNSMGGSAVSDQIIEKNTTNIVLPDPEPVWDNHRFDGWYTEDGCINKFSFPQTSDHGFMLYAKWIPIYDVKFDTNGGSFASDSDRALSLQHIEEGKFALSPNAARKGQDFLGWFTAATGGTKWDPSVSINKNTDLFAHWQLQPRTITFKYTKPDGTFVKNEIVETLYGSKITPPADPDTTEGWNFLGWYKSNDTKWDFSTTQVNDNETLTSKFEKIKFNIRFIHETDDVKGVTNTATDIPGLEYGSKVTKPSDPLHKDYLFTRWYTDEARSAGNEWDFNKTVSSGDADDNGDIRLYAGWEIKKYTVSFNVHGGTPVSSQTVEIRKPVTKPVTDRDGYKLAGWYTTDQYKQIYDFSTPVTQDMTIHAKWDEAHVVSFNTAGGTPIAPIKVVSGNSLKKSDIPETTKEGYRLKGWYTKPECEDEDIYDFNTPVNVDIELFAAWEKEQYTVTFESEGSPIGTQTVYYQDKVIRPASDPERTGFDFTGWYKNKKCTISWNFDTELMPAGDITIYAGWGPVMLTVSFDSMSSDAVVTPESYTVSYGSLLPVPVASREGYILDGWYTSKNFKKTEKWDFSGPVTESRWLYANWLVRQCTVIFDTDGGSDIATQKVLYGDTVSVSVVPVKTGFRFKGWYKDSGRTIKYNFDSPVKDDITIYAKWEAAPSYKVTAIASPSTYGSVNPSGTFSVKESSSQKLTFTPKTGYEVYKLKIDNEERDYSANSYILESISKNHTVTVYFREIPVVKHIISAGSADEFGMISPSGEVPVTDGDDVTFYTDALDGYVLDHLEIDGEIVSVSTDSYTFRNVKKDHSIIAHFTKYDPPAPVGHAKVRFILDGAEIAREIVSLGQVVKRPVDPEKDDHIFMGWYEGNWKWNFSDTVEKDLNLEARFISRTVSPDDVHSGMDDRMNLSDPDDITMVKGQSYDFGPGIWSSSNKQILTIKKKTGVAKAKNPSNVPVTITNTAVFPNVSYKIKVVSPELSAKKLTMGVGSTQKITVLYSGGLNVAWMSSNPRVAQVDDGMIKSIAKGKADICAYLNGMKFTCKVTVSDKFTTPGSFDDVTEFTLRPGQTLNLKNIAVEGIKPNKLDWRIIDEDGSKDIGKSGWLAWDDGIVRIDVTGKLKAKGVGTSTIIGRRGDTRVKTIKVTVDTIPTKTETYINVGRNEKLSYYKVNNAKAHWSATNEGETVLLGSTAKTMGTVYGINVGSSVVSCSYNGLEYSTKVHVEDPELSTEDSRIGRIGNYEYFLTLKNGTRFVTDLPDVTQHVVWKSKDKKIAFVDENGIIEGRKQGRTTVLAKINGTTVSIRVFVTQ